MAGLSEAVLPGFHALIELMSILPHFADPCSQLGDAQIGERLHRADTAESIDVIQNHFML